MIANELNKASVWNSFIHTDKTNKYFKQHKSKSKFFSLKVAIFTPLLKTINHCTALLSQ